MPRHPRVHAAGLLYHVTARGNNGQKIFLKNGDYNAFLDALAQVSRRYPWRLYAYVLMPNHFHLLLEVSNIPTARIMQSLLTGYVKYFNTAHNHQGHLFQGRYKAIVCDRDRYLAELVRYIHLNPLRAKLVKRLSDWPWSGHVEYLGNVSRGLTDPAPPVAELKSLGRYAAFVQQGIKEKYRAEWHPGDQAPFLGADKFVKKLLKETVSAPGPRRPSLEIILQKLVAHSDCDAEAIRRRGRSAKVVETRDGFIRKAVLEQGYRPAEVAGFLGCHPSNVSRALQKSASSSVN